MTITEKWCLADRGCTSARHTCTTAALWLLLLPLLLLLFPNQLVARLVHVVTWPQTLFGRKAAVGGDCPPAGLSSPSVAGLQHNTRCIQCAACMQQAQG